MSQNSKTTQLLSHLQQDLPALLGDNLVGVYLHGSYVLKSYHENVSDLDYIIVVKEPLTDQQKLTLMTWTVTTGWQFAPKKGLEFHVLLEKWTQHFIQPLPFDFHFSPMHWPDYQENPLQYVQEMQGTDPDLAAHLTILTHYGQVISGPAIEQVFAPVPRSAYLNSILADISNAEQAVLTNPVYVCLNLARVLAYLQTDQVLSKAAGGRWLLEQNILNHDQRQLISWCLAQYEATAVGELPVTTAVCQGYAQQLLTAIHHQTKMITEKEAH
ncbi:aminoglycoside adenylyltransferase domain-containing protein [Lapidilactobacillus wuchangensis]|uniref:aminoglycoside adenylyltransferase domain-containing protein n=1 Tax=Lapidilactobacillus wuchangensis TaxID=2486001 RepID=UPI000F79978E|nr:aminoglycoside adenylyltransferase domain-containing protein [Lapidilactobacillus wuchangensis]